MGKKFTEGTRVKIKDSKVLENYDWVVAGHTQDREGNIMHILALSGAPYFEHDDLHYFEGLEEKEEKS